MDSQMAKILGITMLLTSSCVNATIIDNDTYLTDSLSGLDWLDLSATYNQARRTVGTRLQNSGDLSGWRYASRNEMFGLVSRFDNIRGPQTANQLSGFITSDSNGFANADVFTDSWSTLFDLLGPSSVKSSALPSDSHEYMFGLYNYRNVPEITLQQNSGTLQMGLAGFSNCDDIFAVNCRSSSTTQYNPTPGQNRLTGFNARDYYHLDVIIDSNLFNQQQLLDQRLAQLNVNPAQGGGQDLNFGSFLVRNNATPCDDNDVTTLDVRSGPTCSYTPSGIAPPPLNSVPEPSTLGIFALGLMGLASRRFKKQA
jgi:hypothetical protein